MNETLQKIYKECLLSALSQYANDMLVGINVVYSAEPIVYNESILFS